MLTFRTFVAFPDTSEAREQVETAFADAAVTLGGRGQLSLIGELSVSIQLQNPMVEGWRTRRGSYHKPTETYFVEAHADYARWVMPDWRQRTEDYARAIKDAVGRVAKTRLPESERTALLEWIDRLVVTVAITPPDDVKPLKSVQLDYSTGSPRPSIGFEVDGNIAGLMLPDSRVVVVAPEDAAVVAAGIPKREQQEPETFKLYKRDESSLRYHEAWAHEGEITEHWGVCGEEGDTAPHLYSNLAAGEKIMRAIKRKARQAGFSSLARSKHRQLVIELPVDGFGAEDDLGTRHKLEDYFNNRLGWLGLGHVDGGSIGSGSMEIFCIVPDFAVAKAAIEKELVELEIEDARLYEMK